MLQDPECSCSCSSLARRGPCATLPSPNCVKDRSYWHQGSINCKFGKIVIFTQIQSTFGVILTVVGSVYVIRTCTSKQRFPETCPSFCSLVIPRSGKHVHPSLPPRLAIFAIVWVQCTFSNVI